MSEVASGTVRLLTTILAGRGAATSNGSREQVTVVDKRKQEEQTSRDRSKKKRALFKSVQALHRPIGKLKLSHPFLKEQKVTKYEPRPTMESMTRRAFNDNF